MVTQEERITEQIGIIEEIHAIVSKLVAESGYDGLEPEDYFIWMYSVEPFAEA